MSEIIPAILPKDISDLESQISKLPTETKIVHFDVLEEDVWQDLDGLEFEAHLMVKNPSGIMKRWVDRGAKRIIIHEPREEILNYKEEVEIGLGVNLDKSLEEISPLVPKVDFLHLMSIAQIGAQGRPLDEKIFDRISNVKKQFPQLPLSVDGGIKTSNYLQLIDLGVDRLIVGSGFEDLWKSLTKN